MFLTQAAMPLLRESRMESGEPDERGKKAFRLLPLLLSKRMEGRLRALDYLTGCADVLWRHGTAAKKVLASGLTPGG